jgi:hypothetical protein
VLNDDACSSDTHTRRYAPSIARPVSIRTASSGSLAMIGACVSSHSAERRRASGGRNSATSLMAAAYAASGTARTRASACDRRASITRSAWRATRSKPRTRSGARPYSCFKRPDSRSTEARPRLEVFEPLNVAREEPPAEGELEGVRAFVGGCLPRREGSGAS